MDRLTRYATEPHSDSGETITQLISFVREYPTRYISALNISHTNEQVERLTNEDISLYIALYYYCAVANFFAQTQLPKLEEFESNSEAHDLTKKVLDFSQSDFMHMQGVVNGMDSTRLQASSLYDLYQKTENFWKQLVKNSTEAFQDRENA